ncbi:MAG: universal stress protein [Nitrospirota bacterium]
MKTEKADRPSPIKDRHILIAVDGSDNAKRVVLYVADFLGGVPGFRVTLLSIIPESLEDFFNTDKERQEWYESRRTEAAKMTEDYRRILIQSGFSEDKVNTRVVVKECPSIAECILNEQIKLECCTVIIGRRGISRKEEFIFGSTSNKILHAKKGCAVWVIE